MKIFKKILSVTLVLIMVLSAVPLSSLVGIELPDFNFGIKASAKVVASSGKCGDNVSYTYDSSSKRLVISGTGPMDNYSQSYVSSTSYSSGYYKSDSPFYDSDIKTLVIEEGITSIGNNAFYDCDSLSNISISNTVKSIGISAFSECVKIASIIIPGSVKTIGSDAFYKCNGLTSVVISDGVESIGSYAFSGCNITSVTIPGSVKTINNDAFSRCYSLTSVTISDGVESIGSSAFYGCNFTSVTIPGSVKNIGNRAFSSCDGLINVYLPDALTVLGEYTFAYCDALKNIALPDNLERVESKAFYQSGLTKIFVPKSVEYISNKAFKKSNLEEIYYEGSKRDWRSIKGTGSYKYGTGVNVNYNYDHSHAISTTIVPATQDTDGVIKENCNCGYFKNTILHKIDTIKLEKTEYFYTGDVIIPSIVIKDSVGNRLKENIDYNVTTSGKIKNAGEYDVNINFINNYSGNKTLSLKVYDLIEKFELNSKKVTLAKNQTFTIKPIITPATAKQTVKYSTANENIATVSSRGVIKGVAAGKTTITVTAADGKTAKISVEVCDVKLNATSKTMNIGQNYTLKLSNSKYKVSKWSSSDSKIVKVDSNGLITAKAKGTATITVTLSNGIKFTCKVTVKKVSLSATKVTVLKYNNTTLTLKEALGTVKWSSSNTKVAKVSSTGVVTGVDPGTATITATYLGVKYNCTVTVKNQASISVLDVDWDIDSAGGVETKIKITNNSTKDIKYISIYTEYRNRFADPAYCEVTGKNTKTLKVESGLMAKTTRTFYWDPVIYNSHVSRVDIKKVVITFVDNSKETININKYWYDQYYYYK